MRERRKTRKRFEHPGEARFLTFSCVHHLSLFTNDAIKDHFAVQLRTVYQRLGFTLHGWVVMPDHVHLLLTPDAPRITVPRILMSLKRPFSRTVLDRWRELRAPILDRLTDARGRARFWQPGGGYDRNIYSDEEFLEKLIYIHNNPVTRGLVAQPNDWHWSSARWYAGCDDALIGLAM